MEARNIIWVVPLATKPHELGTEPVGGEGNSSKMFVGRTARGVEGIIGRAEKFMKWPISTLALL